MRWRCCRLHGAATHSLASLRDAHFSDPTAALPDSRRAAILVHLKMAPMVNYFDIDLSVFLKD
jgi:hypothetical protein